MKVIRKTVLDKINEEIDKDPDSIVRIELNNDEFKDLLNADGVMRHFNRESISMTALLTGDYSGSYVVHRGICIQTHESYQ